MNATLLWRKYLCKCDYVEDLEEIFLDYPGWVLNAITSGLMKESQGRFDTYTEKKGK